MRVMIDPGHGGEDPGAIGRGGLREADVALAICLLLKKQLSAVGVEVFMTRESDITVPLPRRAVMANAVEADIFLSVHCNSTVDPEVHGIETWFHRGSAKGRKLAERIQRSLMAAFADHVDRGAGEDTKLYRDGLYILRATKMPAALAEIEFISNPGMEDLMRFYTYREAVAKALAAGLEKYFEGRARG